MDASDADAMPLPSEDTTPPVTKIREVMIGPFVESDILTARIRMRESLGHVYRSRRAWRPKTAESRRCASCPSTSVLRIYARAERKFNSDQRHAVSLAVPIRHNGLFSMDTPP